MKLKVTANQNISVLFFRDILRIFPRAKLVILPPEVYDCNGTTKINPHFDKQKVNRDGDRKNGKIAEHLEYITSNGIKTKAICSIDSKRRGRYYLNE